MHTNKKLDLRPIREKRKKKERMLKYFQVKNNVMSLWSYKEEYKYILDINFH